jgi:hypothetical protein
MKPEPVPRGTENTFRVQRSTTFSRVEMNTTEAFDFSNSSIVAFSSACSSPRGVTGRGAAFASVPEKYHPLNAAMVDAKNKKNEIPAFFALPIAPLFPACF